MPPCAHPAHAQATGRCVALTALSRGSVLEDDAAAWQQQDAWQRELAELQGAVAEELPTCWEVSALLLSLLWVEEAVTAALRSCRPSPGLQLSTAFSACLSALQHLPLPGWLPCACLHPQLRSACPTLRSPTDRRGLLPAQHGVAVGAAATRLCCRPAAGAALSGSAAGGRSGSAGCAELCGTCCASDSLPGAIRRCSS